MSTYDPNSPVWLLLLGVALVIGIVFALPTLIAFVRRHPHRWLIFLVNAFAGPTVVGWFIALVWSCWIPKTEN